MTELIGKIVLYKNKDMVLLFRLNDSHKEELHELEGTIVEADNIFKQIWYEAYDIMGANKNSDMGLQINIESYKLIKKRCTQDTLQAE